MLFRPESGYQAGIKNDNPLAQPMSSDNFLSRKDGNQDKQNIEMLNENGNEDFADDRDQLEEFNDEDAQARWQEAQRGGEGNNELQYESAINDAYEELKIGLVQSGIQKVELILSNAFIEKPQKQFSEILTKIVKILNYLAIDYLNQQLKEESYSMLALCEKLTKPSDFGFHPSLRALTFNHLGCFARRNGELKKAVNLFQNALQTLLSSNSRSYLGLTYLNLSAIFSQQQNHKKALQFARSALMESQHEVLEMSQREKYSWADLMENDIEYVHKISTLAISYHNIAVQEEFFMNYDQALFHFESSYNTASEYLGQEHRVTNQFKNQFTEFNQRYARFKQNSKDMRPHFDNSSEEVNRTFNYIDIVGTLLSKGIARGGKLRKKRKIGSASTQHSLEKFKPYYKRNIILNGQYPPSDEYFTTKHVSDLKKRNVKPNSNNNTTTTISTSNMFQNLHQKHNSYGDLKNFSQIQQKNIDTMVPSQNTTFFGNLQKESTSHIFSSNDESYGAAFKQRRLFSGKRDRVVEDFKFPGQNIDISQVNMPSPISSNLSPQTGAILQRDLNLQQNASSLHQTETSKSIFIQTGGSENFQRLIHQSPASTRKFNNFNGNSNLHHGGGDEARPETRESLLHEIKRQYEVTQINIRNLEEKLLSEIHQQDLNIAVNGENGDMNYSEQVYPLSTQNINNSNSNKFVIRTMSATPQVTSSQVAPSKNGASSGQNIINREKFFSTQQALGANNNDVGSNQTTNASQNSIIVSSSDGSEQKPKSILYNNNHNNNQKQINSRNGGGDAINPSNIYDKVKSNEATNEQNAFFDISKNDFANMNFRSLFIMQQEQFTVYDSKDKKQKQEGTLKVLFHKSNNYIEMSFITQQGQIYQHNINVQQVIPIDPIQDAVPLRQDHFLRKVTDCLQNSLFMSQKHQCLELNLEYSQNLIKEEFKHNSSDFVSKLLIGSEQIQLINKTPQQSILFPNIASSRTFSQEIKPMIAQISYQNMNYNDEFQRDRNSSEMTENLEPLVAEITPFNQIQRGLNDHEIVRAHSNSGKSEEHYQRVGRDEIFEEEQDYEDEDSFKPTMMIAVQKAPKKNEEYAEFDYYQEEGIDDYEEEVHYDNSIDNGFKKSGGIPLNLQKLNPSTEHKQVDQNKHQPIFNAKYRSIEQIQEDPAPSGNGKQISQINQNSKPNIDQRSGMNQNNNTNQQNLMPLTIKEETFEESPGREIENSSPNFQKGQEGVFTQKPMGKYCFGAAPPIYNQMMEDEIYEKENIRSKSPEIRKTTSKHSNQEEEKTEQIGPLSFFANQNKDQNGKNYSKPNQSSIQRNKTPTKQQEGNIQVVPNLLKEEQDEGNVPPQIIIWEANEPQNIFGTAHVNSTLPELENDEKPNQVAPQGGFNTNFQFKFGGIDGGYQEGDEVDENMKNQAFQNNNYPIENQNQRSASNSSNKNAQQTSIHNNSNSINNNSGGNKKALSQEEMDDVQRLMQQSDPNDLNKAATLIQSKFRLKKKNQETKSSNANQGTNNQTEQNEQDVMPVQNQNNAISIMNSNASLAKQQLQPIPKKILQIGSTQNKETKEPHEKQKKEQRTIKVAARDSPHTKRSNDSYGVQDPEPIVIDGDPEEINQATTFIQNKYREQLQRRQAQQNQQPPMGRFEAALLSSQSQENSIKPEKEEIVIEGDPEELNKAASFIQTRYRNKKSKQKEGEIDSKEDEKELEQRQKEQELKQLQKMNEDQQLVSAASLIQSKFRQKKLNQKNPLEEMGFTAESQQIQDNSSTIMQAKFKKKPKANEEIEDMNGNFFNATVSNVQVKYTKQNNNSQSKSNKSSSFKSDSIMHMVDSNIIGKTDQDGNGEINEFNSMQNENQTQPLIMPQETQQDKPGTKALIFNSKNRSTGSQKKQFFF